MNRRTALAAIAAAGIGGSSGCLGHRTEENGDLSVQRSGPDTGDECEERELLDNERVSLAPRHYSLVGFENAVQWEVSLQEGEELYVRITSSDVMYQPRFEVTGPDGNVILNDDSGQSIHRIHPDRDGPYTLWLGDRRSDGGEWFLDVVWYSGVGCSDPYG